MMSTESVHSRVVIDDGRTNDHLLRVSSVPVVKLYRISNAYDQESMYRVLFRIDSKVSRYVHVL